MNSPVVWSSMPHQHEAPAETWEAASGAGARLTHIESAPLAATMESSRTHGPQQGAALMKRTTKHVALDAHEATTVGLVREESGRVMARRVLPMDGLALPESFRGMHGTINVACASRSYSQIMRRC